MRFDSPRSARLLFTLLMAGVLLGWSQARAQEEGKADQPPLSVATPGTVAEATPITAEASAVVNFGELARQAARSPAQNRPVRTWMPREFEAPPEPYFPPAPESRLLSTPGIPLAPSPLPTTSFKGLDDVPMADSSYIVIPPDVGGAVGPDRVMCGFNNNYRIFNKSTGAIVSTLGTATFWAAVVAPSERLSLTDPRTIYDPYNDRWIAVMQTVTSGAGKILVGVSQTSDPAGSWYLYSFNSGATIDFPNLGFNKNWISVAINRYSFIGTFQRGINLVVDYPSARAGTGSGTLVTMSANSHFCSGPCATYSATEETLYVVTHLSSSGATYELDTITGTPGSPTYTNGGSHTRTGGGWAQASGNALPQSAPNSGSSACGSTPCRIEAQDAYIRACPTYRDGSIYYAQTVGLPSSSYTHTAAQWTKIAAPSGAYVDGGRVEDPTANATNGGKWYSHTQIAVNAAGSFMLAYTQFSSTQHPSAGYSMHVAGDAAGTLRDPQVYHAGEDYYHKTFSTANGRNRWGDFSTAQVDPSDDLTLWALQEYGGTRPGTDDGNTGANSSRWSSWWAGVGTGLHHHRLGRGRRVHQPERGGDRRRRGGPGLHHHPRHLLHRAGRPGGRGVGGSDHDYTFPAVDTEPHHQRVVRADKLCHRGLRRPRGLHQPRRHRRRGLRRRPGLHHHSRHLLRRAGRAGGRGVGGSDDELHLHRGGYEPHHQRVVRADKLCHRGLRRPRAAPSAPSTPSPWPAAPTRRSPSPPIRASGFSTWRWTAAPSARTRPTPSPTSPPTTPSTPPSPTSSVRR